MRREARKALTTSILDGRVSFVPSFNEKQTRFSFVGAVADEHGRTVLVNLRGRVMDGPAGTTGEPVAPLTRVSFPLNADAHGAFKFTGTCHGDAGESFHVSLRGNVRHSLNLRCTAVVEALSR